MTQGEYHDRLRKRAVLLEKGIHPHPSRFESTHSLESLVLNAKTQAPRELDDILSEPSSSPVTVRGRIMTVREHGKLSFANLKDASGTLQICFMKDLLGDETYKNLRLLDMGDFLGCSGELFITKHGQLTLLISNYLLLGKTLRPLPEKWHGLQNQESIYRQRYLDLLMNDESMERFLVRSRFVQAVRDYLNKNDFIEVETPILATKASGAAARPFATHHKALDLDLYLRIAPELYLKRCVAGGFERVYEFAKCFRNEGMDPSHLQEFTMLEYYVAYWNYEDNMNFTEALLTHSIESVFGTLKFTVPSRDGALIEVDFSAPWPRREFGDLILEDCGIDIYSCYEDAKALRALIRKKKIALDDMDSMGYGNLCDALYKKVSRPKLIQPTFVIHHPASTKPLARRMDSNPQICETFQLLVNTWEVLNAYSEIVDPVDQKERFISQSIAEAGGDEEAVQVDLDYLRCMEHGMPPMSGFGMGMDRILALLTNQDNLRDLVLFPVLRPLEEDLKEEKALRRKAKNRLA